MNNLKQCSACGATFEGRSNKIYCSDSCKQRAFQRNQQSISVATVQPDKKALSARSAVSGVGPTKTEVEIARLRFAAEEKLRLIEVEERQRDRQHELERQERLFKQETQRAESEQELSEQRWMDERKGLLNRLDGLEDYLAATQKAAPKEIEEISDGVSSSPGLNTFLLIAGGTLLFRFLSKVASAPPAPTKRVVQPPTQPQQTSKFPSVNGLLTDL